MAHSLVLKIGDETTIDSIDERTLKEEYERQRERFQQHGLVMAKEILAHAEETGLRRYPADLVQELPRGLDSHTEIVHVFLHLLHLGGFARGRRTHRLV